MTAKILVTAAGLLLIVAVNVYFLRPGRRKRRRPDQNLKRSVRLNRR